jgi:beta-phosphoglucomutase-like phosphatase (HAD superfamily)
VTGSAKQEIQIMLNENIESNKFDMVITGDDLGQGLGKPDPTSFQIALQRMNLSPLERYSSSKFENSPYHITSLASSIMSNIG